MNADPESQSLLAQILLLIVLTLINAFLAASEIAVVSVNKPCGAKAEEGNVKSQNYWKSLIIQQISCQRSKLGLPWWISYLGHLWQIPCRPVWHLIRWRNGSCLANIIVLAILTYASIVFGELYPKRIAMNKSEEVAQFTSGVIRTIGIIAKPSSGSYLLQQAYWRESLQWNLTMKIQRWPVMKCGICWNRRGLWRR